MKLLIVEDEAKLADYLRKGLAEEGYVVEVAGNGVDGLHMAIEGSHDLIVLDTMLPGIDGLGLLAALRQSKQTPVIMLTARHRVEDRVRGLKAGADDYLVKPFAFSELVARCRALVRRPRSLEMEPVKFGNLLLRPDTLELSVQGEALAISRREGQLLVALLRRPGRVCTRTYLETALYDPNLVVSPNALETSISRLRSLLQGVSAQVEIKTVRGVGYALTESGLD